jgi:hypothetical protein
VVSKLGERVWAVFGVVFVATLLGVLVGMAAYIIQDARQLVRRYDEVSKGYDDLIARAKQLNADYAEVLSAGSTNTLRYALGSYTASPPLMETPRPWWVLRAEGIPYTWTPFTNRHGDIAWYPVPNVTTNAP